MSETATVGKIYGIIPKMIKECEHIAKDRKNAQQGYNFRGIDDVYNAMHPLLAKYGIFCVNEILTCEREERATAKGGTLLYTRITARYKFYADDGSFVVSDHVGEGMDSADKASSKAMSMAYKYAFFQLLCIPTELLADPDAETPPPSKPATFREGLVNQAINKLIDIVAIEDATELFAAFDAWGKNILRAQPQEVVHLLGRAGLNSFSDAAWPKVHALYKGMLATALKDKKLTEDQHDGLWKVHLDHYGEVMKRINQGAAA